MIIIGMTDIHGKLSYMDRMAGPLAEADWVILTGDITNFGREAETEEVLERVRRHNTNILAVHGNCDFPEVEQELEQKGINIHRAFREIDGLGIIGMGASLPTPFSTPSEITDEDFESYWTELAGQIPDGMPLVMISHQPPVNTLCDRISTGAHVGSHAVRRFIETHKPLVCLTGHIHEGNGVDTIGETRIINPGLFGQGHYAYVRLARKQDTYVLEEVRIETL